MIENAEHEIELAQYRALHNRLEDFVTYMISTGYLAKRAIYPEDPGPRTGEGEYLFELIEAYLDQANENEDRGPLLQILRPDLDAE